MTVRGGQELISCPPVTAPVDARPRTRVAVHLLQRGAYFEAYSWNSSVTGGKMTVQLPLGFLTWSYFCLGAPWVLPWAI